MKKNLFLVSILFLFITGCSNSSLANKTISQELYQYSVSDWKHNPLEQEKVVFDIIRVWENNKEVYPVNFAVNVESIKERIEDYIEKTSNDSESIFKISCHFVFVDSSLYNVK